MAPTRKKSWTSSNEKSFQEKEISASKRDVRKTRDGKIIRWKSGKFFLLSPIACKVIRKISPLKCISEEIALNLEISSSSSTWKITKSPRVELQRNYVTRDIKGSLAVPKVFKLHESQHRESHHRRLLPFSSHLKIQSPFEKINKQRKSNKNVIKLASGANAPTGL